MNPNEASLFKLSEECISQCEALIECLRAERQYLIEFKLEALLQNNVKKESLLSGLVKRKTSLQQQAQVFFPDTQSAVWRAEGEKWQKVWGELKALCERNQSFMRHSLKNLGLIVDNLRNLFGDFSMYSPKGTRVDLKTQGNVVERAY